VSAYLIANVNVTDPEQYKVYQKFSSEAMLKHGAKVLARGGEVSVLEGGAPGRTVVLEFPDRTAAENFYNSQEYRRARSERANAANMTMYIVQGA
jgi:uncharacterized protein (DUF1330 family)